MALVVKKVEKLSINKKIKAYANIQTLTPSRYKKPVQQIVRALVVKKVEKMEEAIEGEYYMVKDHETSELEPTMCISRGGNGTLYFKFLDSSVMEVARVYYFEPLNHVRKC